MPDNYRQKSYCRYPFGQKKSHLEISKNKKPTRRIFIHFAFLVTDLNFNAVKSPQKEKQSN